MTPKAIAAELRGHATSGLDALIPYDATLDALREICQEDEAYMEARASGGLLEGFSWFTLRRFYLLFIAEMIESEST